jgi:hypothetical protein
MANTAKETCKWTHYKGDSVWHLPCGKTQGIKCRPNEKTCFCPKDGKRRRIERVELDEISPRDKEFIEICKIFK